MRFLFFILFLGTLPCCRPATERACLKSEGDRVLMPVDLNGVIRNLWLHDDLHLRIVPDTVHALWIEGGENMVNNVTIEQNDTLLKCFNRSRCYFLRNFRHEVTLVLHTDTLHEINCYGYGNVTSTLPIVSPEIFTINCWNSTGIIDLSFNNREVHAGIHGGPAEVRLAGSSNLGYYYNAGTGQIRAENLEAGDVYFRANSSGDIYASATGLLAGSIEGPADLHYTGDPDVVEVEQKGTGGVYPF